METAKFGKSPQIHPWSITTHVALKVAGGSGAYPRYQRGEGGVHPRKGYRVKICLIVKCWNAFPFTIINWLVHAYTHIDTTYPRELSDGKCISWTIIITIVSLLK